MSEELYEELFPEIEILERKEVQPTKVSDMAALTALFESQGWGWDIVGFGSMITAPEYTEGIYYLPKSMDKSIIPQEGLQRLKAVEEMGIRIQGVIVGHETKEPVKGKVFNFDWMELQQRAISAKEKTIVATKTTAKVAGGVLLGAAGLAGLILGATVSIIPSLLVDPMIIIVLDDEATTWIEIFFWEV